ncbi:MAG: glycosyltransferase family 1 protein [Sedimentibacter sp.]|uniref:glycosyltransferase family 1 protein n=1 Tax=Sedimentibacter sp. TaxID=1960295 RepID=UPI0029824722|nr:glycosyltransferase family 1 protein [Sedimentibacter sp.]MDW5298975.1 glycosyltransferase family 1 protein [Sedimentibacter sp.]
MIRILNIMGTMNMGGAETFLMKVYRNIDRKKIQFDFLVSKPGVYDNEIISLGGKIFTIPLKSKSPIKHHLAIKNIVRSNNYKTVLRCSSHTLAYLDFLAAKKGGATKFIMRSTSSKGEPGVFPAMLHRLFRRKLNEITTFKIAPSTDAGIWLFGEKTISEDKFTLVNNGIEAQKFIFNENSRIMIRNELNLENKFVVGHIGRFTEAKNHEYLLKIFTKIVKKNKESILLLIGEGELELKIKNMINSYGLKDNVKILNNRLDIPELLMAMDIYVFPSLYEGMPNTVIEAQATGLKCLLSDRITKEVKLTNLVDFLPINISDEVWARKALEVVRGYKREDMSEEIKSLGYDIEAVSKWFKNIILEELE